MFDICFSMLSYFLLIVFFFFNSIYLIILSALTDFFYLFKHVAALVRKVLYKYLFIFFSLLFLLFLIVCNSRVTCEQVATTIASAFRMKCCPHFYGFCCLYFHQVSSFKFKLSAPQRPKFAARHITQWKLLFRSLICLIINDVTWLDKYIFI